jgi:hypothetical protein
MHLGQAFDVFCYPSEGEVRLYLQSASASALAILKMRAEKGHGQISKTRCHKAECSDHIWQLTTDDGARFLYFQDGPRRLVVVTASNKVKAKKFRIEVERADQLRLEYLELKKGHVK